MGVGLVKLDEDGRVVSAWERNVDVYKAMYINLYDGMLDVGGGCV